MFNFKLLNTTLIAGLLSMQVAYAQNKVVVVPLGGDVSANQVYKNRVYSGIVQSNGSEGGGGHFVSERISEGVYDVSVYPPEGVFYIPGDAFPTPTIVVTSIGVARIAAVSLQDDVTTYVRFRVTLRAFDGTIANASFYFQAQWTYQDD